MLAWAIPITGEGISGGAGERPDNSLPPWLPSLGGGAKPPTIDNTLPGGGERPEISLPIVLPPPSIALPPGSVTPVPPGVWPKPPDGAGDWMIVYTPDGGWQFIRAGDLLEAIKAKRPQPK